MKSKTFDEQESEKTENFNIINVKQRMKPRICSYA